MKIRPFLFRSPVISATIRKGVSQQKHARVGNTNKQRVNNQGVIEERWGRDGGRWVIKPGN